MAENQGLKCAKCRPPGVLVTPEQYSSPAEAQGPDTLWILDQDNLPEFVQAAIEESGWTKGRINCPNCQARIGSFDFVAGAENPVHLVKSKMDETVSSSELSATLQRRSASDQSSSTEGSEQPSTSRQSLAVQTDTSSSDVGDEGDADVVEMDIVFSGGGDMRLLSRKRIKKTSLISHKKFLKRKKAKEEKFIQEILNSEPELDEIDPSLICPVCLDLLHNPFSTIPCKHTFCETCLRRIGSKNAMDTTCPMCRQTIMYCNVEKDLTSTIKLQFPEMYEKRRLFEKTSPNVFNMPLPWKPGWRNLISGRPMGGNRFNTRSSGEVLRRVVQQLPYYIPPVVLANFVNLIFFVFLLFAVEVVPTLLGLLMKRKHPDNILRGVEVLPATGDVNPEYEDEANEPASTLDTLTNEENRFYPSPEDASPVMDTTFHYALYMVLLVGTLVGNFFLLHHPTTLIPRGSTLDRWLNHPQWGRINRRLLDFALVIALTAIPMITLPLLSPLGLDTKASWLSNLVEFCASFIAFPYLFVAVTIVWLVSVYFDCQQDDFE